MPRVPDFITRRLPAGTKTAILERLRRLTAPVRRLPDFIILGAMKCGTSSLYYYLDQHPWVRTSRGSKEVHYFDRNYDKSERWYRSHFPLPADFFYDTPSSEDGTLVTGEASPYYLFHPHAPGRIAATVPEARFIILLRNPADRALSHYHHSVRNGHEPLSFEEALAREDDRLRGECRKVRRDEHYDSRAHRVYSYKHRGQYAEQIEAYFRLFDRDQFLILKSERFFEAPGDVLGEVCRFLGVRPHAFQTKSARNTGRYSKAEHARALAGLDEYFERPNRELGNLLGRDFDWNRERVA